MGADPTTIAAAIRGFDEAAHGYAQSVTGIANLLETEGKDIPAVARLARLLRSQTDHFRASVWPERGSQS